MRTRSLHFVVVFSALLLGACSTLPVHAYLPAEAKDKIASTEVVVPIQQSEIYVFVPVATAGASYGLIGALVDVSIDSIRTSKAEAAVKPLRDALVDYSFDKDLQGEIRTSLAALPFLGADGGRVVKEVTNENLDRILSGSKADGVLFAAANYHLSNDADVLTVSLSVSLFPNNDALRAMVKPHDKPSKSAPKTSMVNALYRNVLVFETRAPVAPDRDHYIAVWSADHGAPMRKALSLAATEMTKMLADDLQRQENPAVKEDASHGTAALEGSTAPVISSDDNGSLMRFGDGTLKYVAKTVP
jgi:hypothetical protein